MIKLNKKKLNSLHSYSKFYIKASYIPIEWKISVIILIFKLNKPPDIPSSYCPIGLLPLFPKLSEKLILICISQLININQIIPNKEFGFRNRYSTI